MAKYKIIPSSRNIVQSPISIGHKAEKGVEAIEFDVTAWVETYGSGTLTVIMRRWGDAIPYPIALEIDENNKATWVLSDTDTAKAGMAYAQLSYIVGETVVKKSDIYTFRVMDSLTGEGEPPEAYESWLEHLQHLAAEAMAEVLDIEGVATDKTLTVDGGIADAKATGDALALKADKSTTYTKTEVDQMIEDVEVETDTTLAVSGAPADAAETGRQIGLIKADLDAQVKSINETLGTYAWYRKGYINLTTDPVVLTPTSNMGIDCLVADCAAGDVFTITASGGVSSRAWGFLDSGNHVLTVADANTQVEELEITAPTNTVKLVVNNKFADGDGSVYKNGNNLASKANSAGLSNDVKAALLACFKTVTWNDGGDNFYDVLTKYIQLDVVSISAVFEQGNNVITQTDELGDLRPMLTVTANFGDHEEEVHSYSLSGRLEAPTSTITVTYGSVSTKFTVEVSTLPSGYYKENYVEADGSQYVASGVYETDLANAWIRYKAYTPSTNLDDYNNRHVLSSQNEFIPHPRYFINTGTRTYSSMRAGNQTTNYDFTPQWELDEDFTIEAYRESDKIYTNKVHRTTIEAGSQRSSSNQLYFFAAGGALSAPRFRYVGKLYYFKVFGSNGVKTHDFVPCKNSNGVAGLYDLVTNVFHAPVEGTLIAY